MRRNDLLAGWLLFVMVLLPAMLLAHPAAAHMPSGSVPPAGFSEGLFAGLVHPVVGLDHLAFIVAVGLAAGLSRFGATLPLLFVAASAAGAAMHVSGLVLPAAEPLIAVSVMLVGLLLVSTSGRSAVVWSLLLAVAGIAHGYAHGEAVMGSGAPAMLAYLLGLALTQGGLMAAVGMLASRWSSVLLMPRLAGGAIIAIGALALTTVSLASG